MAIIDEIAQLSARGEAFVVATLVDAQGSTPSDAGAKMLVTPGGLHAGTVGGGRIEARALAEAKALLDDPAAPSTRYFEWNLQRDIGMTCGGVVRVYFEVFNRADWQVVVFGAGHVAQQLVRLLLTVPCCVTCIDPRREWLEKLPQAAALRAVQAEEPRALVKDISERAFVVCMTQGHKTDRPVLEEIFRQGREFPFLGVIGSKSKANVLRRELREAGISAKQAKGFVCPVGLPLGSNHPGEIAVSIAAQLLQVRDERMGATESKRAPRKREKKGG